MISLKHPTNLPNSRVEHHLRLNGCFYKLILDTNLPTQRYIHDILAAGGIYEPESTIEIIKELKPGECFFDVGANCGWFSALAAVLVGEVGKVFAWEPMPENLAALAVNTPRATAIQAVASDTDGELDLYVNLDNDGGHSLWPCGLHPFNSGTVAAGNPVSRVKSVRLDEWASHNPNILKIDTEGAECNVLLGAEKVLANPSLRMVVCERHPMGLQLLEHTPEEVEGIMERHGFKWERREEQSNIENWIFRR